MSEIAEALTDLLASPGWQHMQQVARSEWATRERLARRRALEDDNDARALDKLRQVTAAQEAVEWLFAWPAEEVARLKRAAGNPTDPNPRRASALSHRMLGLLSRRGSL